MSGTFEAEAEQISSESGVPVDVRVAEGRGFDGADTALVVVTVLAGGIGGGILSAVGSDVWARIKRLVHRAKKSDYQCTLVVVRKIGETEIRYRCDLDRPEDVDRVVTALQDAQADAAYGGGSGEPIVLRLDVDDVWKPAG